MKLLLDQGLPRSAAALLRGAGIDAVHTGEINYATAEDEAIIEKAQQDDRVIVTLDADFHALIALSGASSPSVIRIRIEHLKAEAVSKLLQRLLDGWGKDLDTGVVMTVQPDRIRFRHLPLRAKHG